MATTTPTPVQTVITTSESWLKQHERLLIVVFLLIFSYFALDKVLSFGVLLDQHRATATTQQVDADKLKVASDLALAQSKLADYESAMAKSTAQNQTLSEAIAERDKQLTATQQANAALQASQLAAKWQGLSGNQGVTANDSGYAVTDEAGLLTVNKLEQVNTLQADLKDERQKNTNLQDGLDKANATIGDGKVLVTGLQSQLKDQAVQCTAQLNLEKAKARKGKFKSFGIGFVTGYVAGLVTKIVL